MKAVLAGLIALLVLAGVCRALPALAADAPSATPQQLAALDEILARPEFRLAEQRSAFDRFVDQVRAWLRRQVRALEQWLAALIGPVAESSSGAVVLVLVGISLMIVLGAAFILSRLVRGSLAGESSLADVSLIRLPRAAAELARARALAEAGEARQALHHQYRAVLLRLDEREHLPFDSTMTNRELVPRLATVPELADPFAELVGRFDRLWYGQTDCSAEEYAAFAKLADRVWQAAETLTPAHDDRHAAGRPGGMVGVPGGAS